MSFSANTITFISKEQVISELFKLINKTGQNLIPGDCIKDFSLNNLVQIRKRISQNQEIQKPLDRLNCNREWGCTTDAGLCSFFSKTSNTIQISFNTGSRPPTLWCQKVSKNFFEKYNVDVSINCDYYGSDDVKIGKAEYINGSEFYHIKHAQDDNCSVSGSYYRFISDENGFSSPFNHLNLEIQKDSETQTPYNSPEYTSEYFEGGEMNEGDNDSINLFYESENENEEEPEDRSQEPTQICATEIVDLCSTQSLSGTVDVNRTDKESIVELRINRIDDNLDISTVGNNEQSDFDPEFDDPLGLESESEEYTIDYSIFIKRRRNEEIVFASKNTKTLNIKARDLESIKKNGFSMTYDKS